jgi:long-chain acyl-CoA synthetase
MTLAPMIAESLARHSGKVVSRDPGTELTAAQLLAGCRTAAGKLTSATSSVGLLLPGCAAYPAALIGSLWAGRVAVPLNTALKPAELDFLIQDAAIDTVVVNEVTRPLLSGLNVRSILLEKLLEDTGSASPDPVADGAEATAVMLYTSGTSGRPKGVPLTHTNLLSNARALIERFGVDESASVLAVLPMFHAFGLTATLIMPLLIGAEVTHLPRFTPDRMASAITEHQVSVLVAVPGMFGLLARSRCPDDALGSLTLPVCGGEALPPNIREGYRRRFGRDLLEGYGLTETAPVVAVNVPSENRPGSVGKVLPGTVVRVNPADGEIQVHGPGVMKGYHLRPEENAAAFTADGWFRTGDMGSLDTDGFLSITGRIKELIIRGGEKVMPREVEEVLCQYPGVLEAAVIGEPDGDRGEAVVAFIVPGEPAPAPEALRDFCRSRLADFKVPRRFTIARDLPRGPTGKVLKRALANWKPE